MILSLRLSGALLGAFSGFGPKSILRPIRACVGALERSRASDHGFRGQKIDPTKNERATSDSKTPLSGSTNSYIVWNAQSLVATNIQIISSKCWKSDRDAHEKGGDFRTFRPVILILKQKSQIFDHPLSCRAFPNRLALPVARPPYFNL